jgi:hypothetical protein
MLILKTKKPRTNAAFLRDESSDRLDLLDSFKHLENRLVGADKKALVVFAEATALKRVATGAFTFSCHDVSGAVFVSVAYGLEL